MTGPTVYTLVATGKTAWIAKKSKVLLDVLASWTNSEQEFFITPDDWTNEILFKGNKEDMIRFLNKNL